MRPSLAYVLAPMVRSALSDPDALTAEQLADLGRAARAIFEAAWRLEQHDRAMIREGINDVVRTFASDAPASERLLRRLLERERLDAHGFEDIPALSYELPQLFVSAPIFCADVYDAAFSREEKSDETTVMTSGVVGLTSKRSQDWKGGRYSLAHEYPGFLEQSPDAAVEALIHVRNAYTARRGYSRLVDSTPQRVDVAGKQTGLIADGAMPDNAMAQEDEAQILSAFAERLKTLARDAPDQAAELVNIVLRKQAPAAVWRCMFSVGGEYPEALVGVLGDLSTAPEVLRSRDLARSVGTFFASAYRRLAEDRRRAIEDVIAAMATDGWQGRHRDHLLASLPDDALATEAARELRATIDVDGVIGGEGEDGGWRSSPYDEHAFMREEGVDVDSEHSRGLDAALAPVKAFAEQHLNDVPTVEDAHAIAPALVELRTVLDESSTHPLQSSSASGYLAQAARAICRQSKLDCDDATRELVLQILFAASEHADPQPRKDDAKSFDESESWGFPASRAEAADGLIRLASRADCNDEGVAAVIERLAGDPSAVVRFHTARAVCVLAGGQPELAWKLVDQLAADQSLAVRKAVVCSLSYMWSLDKRRVVQTTKSVYENVGDRQRSVALRITALKVLTQAYVWSGNEDADAVLSECAARLPQDAEVARAIIFPLRNVLTSGALDGSEPDIDATRARALGLVERLLAAATSAQKAIVEQHHQGMEEWPEEALEQWKAAAGLIDTINMEFYFASGAHRDNNVSEGEHQPTPLQERFYGEAGPIADRLTEIGYPRVAHHLLETLEFFIDVDPRGVFLRMAATIRAGRRWGYQYDNLAEGLFVRIVERYLAEHRTLLQQDADCSKALVEILDIFVRAGWTSARRLTYGLDQIYR
jgi:hypothetical protein